MPRAANGTYNLPAGTIVTTGDTLLVSQHNPAMQDIAAALTNSLSRSGQGTMLSDLNMGGFKVSNAAEGSAAGDLVTLSQLAAYGPLPVQVGVQTDQAPTINAALSSPSNSVVTLPAGVIWINQSVRVPANKTLMMQSGTILRALPTFTNAPSNTNAGVVLAGNRAAVVGGEIDMNKVGANTSNRKNGVMTLNGCRDTVCRDMVIMNCSGYGNYTAGADNRLTPPSKYSENVITYNCQVHHESQASDGDVYLKCEAYDGDADIACGSYFHPLAGTRNCAFIQCRSRGIGGAGVDITTNVNPIENLSMINCDVYLEGTGSAIAIPAEFNLGISGWEVTGGSYTSTQGQGATLRFMQADCIFTGVKFSGAAVGIESTNGSAEFVGCNAYAATNPAGSGAATGVLALGTGMLRWNAGSITATGPVGLMTAAAGNVRVSMDTKLTPAPANGGITIKLQQAGLAAIINDGASCYANIGPLAYTDINKVSMSIAIKRTTDSYFQPTQPSLVTWAVSDAANKILRVRIPAANLASTASVDWLMTERE